MLMLVLVLMLMLVLVFGVGVDQALAGSVGVDDQRKILKLG